MNKSSDERRDADSSDISLSGIEVDDETIALVLAKQIRRTMLETYKKLDVCFRATAVGMRAVEFLRLETARPLPLKGIYWTKRMSEIYELNDREDRLEYTRALFGSLTDEKLRNSDLALGVVTIGRASNHGLRHRLGHVGFEWKGLMVDSTVEQMERADMGLLPPRVVVARLPPDFERNGICQQIGDYGTMMTLWRDPLLEIEAAQDLNHPERCDPQAIEVARRTADELRQLQLERAEKAPIRSAPKRRRSLRLDTAGTSTAASSAIARAPEHAPSLLSAKPAQPDDTTVTHDDSSPMSPEIEQRQSPGTDDAHALGLEI